jgi:hypothetical protein
LVAFSSWGGALAEEMEGLQIGVLNFNEKGILPVFPIFNFGR